MKKFTKSFTQQAAIPDEGIALAIDVMRSGRLHRYNVEPGEKSTTDQLEIAFADYMDMENCLACASCGYALHIALRSVGVRSGDLVLCNGFTLAPVPGAINNAGAVPVLVDIDDNLCIDLDDLELKANQSGAKYLLLSHMRGHIADMDKVIDICHRFDLTLIEDCAHTMGARWASKLSGSFGDVACFSTQTYKHMNSGEGGLLVTPHKTVMAKAIIFSGSYMLYDRHYAAPQAHEFKEVRLDTPNYSGRMDNLRAATLLPQLTRLDDDCKAWNLRHDIAAEMLSTSSQIKLTQRPDKEQYVASSIQFNLPQWEANKFPLLVERCAQRGVVIKWFGSDTPESYTSKYDSWSYLNDDSRLNNTDQVLSTLLDMRLPLTFDEQDCGLIAQIIVEEVEAMYE